MKKDMFSALHSQRNSNYKSSNKKARKRRKVPIETRRADDNPPPNSFLFSLIPSARF